MTALTATKAFIMAMKGSRIEGPKPDSQLKFIHGQEVYDSIKYLLFERSFNMKIPKNKLNSANNK